MHGPSSRTKHPATKTPKTMPEMEMENAALTPTAQTQPTTSKPGTSKPPQPNKEHVPETVGPRTRLWVHRLYEENQKLRQEIIQKEDEDKAEKNILRGQIDELTYDKMCLLKKVEKQEKEIAELKGQNGSLDDCESEVGVKKGWI